MIMTFKEYDALVESLKDKKTLTYWPETECIPLLESEPDKWIKTVIYLTEYGKKPRTKREVESQKMLNRFLRKHLELIEDEDDECVNEFEEELLVIEKKRLEKAQRTEEGTE